MIRKFKAVIIVAVNFMIKFEIANIVTAMQIVSKSEEKIFQMIGVTFMQFFNTAIIMFLVSLDYTTFTVKLDWYVSHGGSVVSAMVFTAVWPIIELIIFGGIGKALRYHDRSYSNNKFATKMPSVQTYIDRHAGADFPIQWRYGAILFQISVALFYGTGLPVLYLIALVGCSIQYVLDRLMVCYMFREPPTYDDRITNVAAEIMQILAVLSLFGSWI